MDAIPASPLTFEQLSPHIVPPGTTCSHLTVQTVDERIAEHEAKIADALATIALHNQAIARYRAYRNSKTDILVNRLPAEIFHEILMQYVYNWLLLYSPFVASVQAAWYHPSFGYGWLKLAHVCRFWRNTLRSLRPLTHITFDHEDVYPEWYELPLTESQNTDLDVSLPLYHQDGYDYNDAMKNWDKVWERMSQHRRRIKSLATDFYLPNSFSFIDMPNIHTLTILDVGTVENHLTAIACSTSLRKLYVDCLSLKWTPQAQVSFLQILSELKRLEYLQISHAPTLDRDVLDGAAGRFIVPLKALSLDGPLDFLNSILDRVTLVESLALQVSERSDRDTPIPIPNLIVKVTDVTTTQADLAHSAAFFHRYDTYSLHVGGFNTIRHLTREHTSSIDSSVQPKASFIHSRFPSLVPFPQQLLRLMMHTQYLVLDIRCTHDEDNHNKSLTAELLRALPNTKHLEVMFSMIFSTDRRIASMHYLAELLRPGSDTRFALPGLRILTLRFTKKLLIAPTVDEESQRVWRGILPAFCDCLRERAVYGATLQTLRIDVINYTNEPGPFSTVDLIVETIGELAERVEVNLMEQNKYWVTS